MMRPGELADRVIAGHQVDRETALELVDAPLEALAQAADRLRRYFGGTRFDLCTILNGKSGRCSEDCKYCAQAACYPTAMEEYPLKSADEILEQARETESRRIPRFSIVTSGKRLNDREVEEMCAAVRLILRETGLKVCVSFGLLDEIQFRLLKAAGVTRIHNNLETSAAFFPEVCTTHSYEDKKAAIRAAQRAGLPVCSGGLLGLGESWGDRVDLALALRECGVDSVPLNILNPIPGTPYEANRRLTDEEVRRAVALFRFILPQAFIRLAGGRGLLEDKGRACFAGGANAAITGDLLTTVGISAQTDFAMLRELGYQTEGAL